MDAGRDQRSRGERDGFDGRPRLPTHSRQRAPMLHLRHIEPEEQPQEPRQSGPLRRGRRGWRGWRAIAHSRKHSGKLKQRQGPAPSEHSSRDLRRRPLRVSNLSGTRSPAEASRCRAIEARFSCLAYAFTPLIRSPIARSIAAYAVPTPLGGRPWAPASSALSARASPGHRPRAECV